MIGQPTGIELNTTTYTAITVSASNGPERPMAFFTDDSSSYLIAIDDSGTGEVAIPAGLGLSMRIADTAGVIFYAKALSGTPNLVVLVGA